MEPSRQVWAEVERSVLVMPSVGAGMGVGLAKSVVERAVEYAMAAA
jgi:hypothetical protein